MKTASSVHHSTVLLWKLLLAFLLLAHVIFLTSQSIEVGISRAQEIIKTEVNTNTSGVVYFIPQIGKSGSSTLRRMFNARGKWYGIPRADDRDVAKEISRKCRETGREDKPTHDDGDETSLVGPYYPFPPDKTKWALFPFFFRLGVEVDPECINHVIHTSWKFWQGAVKVKEVALGEAKGRRPKPAIQYSGPCPSSEAGAATKSVKCHYLMQMRNPITWIESSFGYFCKDCLDKKKFCGKIIDAKCGPKHLEDHETIQSWARKFGNIFTRRLIGSDDMIAGGTWEGGISPDGWTYPNILDVPMHVDEVLQKVKEEEYCVVALEDPNKLSKIEECLGDKPGFYGDELGYTENNATNVRTDKAQLDPNVIAELREILAADIALYDALFPFLVTDVGVALR